MKRSKRSSAQPKEEAMIAVSICRLPIGQGSPEPFAVVLMSSPLAVVSPACAGATVPTDDSQTPTRSLRAEGEAIQIPPRDPGLLRLPPPKRSRCGFAQAGRLRLLAMTICRYIPRVA